MNYEFYTIDGEVWYLTSDGRNERLDETSEEIRKLVKLEEHEAKGVTLSDTKERAFYYRDYVLPAMEAVRKPVDRLEMLVDKSMWPMPSYGDMIFEV